MVRSRVLLALPLRFRKNNPARLSTARRVGDGPAGVADYRSLVHDPACGYTLNLMPFCSLEWSDEHPQSAREVIFDRENHGECVASVVRLVAARTHLWHTGVLREDLRLL